MRSILRRVVFVFTLAVVFILPINVIAATWTAGHTHHTYRAVPNEASKLVMPGDKIVFEEGVEVIGITINYDIGMAVTNQDYSHLNAVTPTLTESKSTTKTLNTVDYQNPTNDAEYHLTAVTEYVNNTDYAVVLTNPGRDNTDPAYFISSYEKDSNGVITKQESARTILYRAIWYPASWIVEWDETHYGNVTDATFQGKNTGDMTRSVIVADNAGYTFTIANPVSEGRHFNCWKVEQVNETSAGVSNYDLLEDVVSTDDGMSVTTASYTPGRYSDTVDNKLVFVSYWYDDYTLTYDAKGGTINGQAKWIYEAFYDEEAKRFTAAGLKDVTPLMDGKIFAGWYVDIDGKKYNFTDLNDANADIYYAEYEKLNNANSSLNLSIYAEYSDPVDKVVLNKTTMTLKKGKSATLKPTISPSTVSDKSVTWKSSDETVATVSASGKVKAVGPGTATITCTTKISGKKAKCKVKVPGIKLNTDTITLKKGTSSKAVKVTFCHDKYKSVKSANTSIAKVSFKKGKLTITAKKAGKTKITIKSKEGYSIKLTVKVQKGKVTTTKIKLSKDKVELSKKGDSETVTFSATPNLVSTGDKVKVTSSNTKIATVKVDKENCTITVTAKKKGDCKITVKIGKKKVTLKVKVKK